jgi:hypothetical protein
MSEMQLKDQNSKLPVSNAGQQGRRTCSERRGLVSNPEASDQYPQQETHRKSSVARARKRRRQGRRHTLAAVLLQVCSTATDHDLHRQRSRLSSQALDRVPTHPPTFPRKRPPKWTMIGGGAPHRPCRTRRVPCRHASGNGHAPLCPLSFREHRRPVPPIPWLPVASRRLVWELQHSAAVHRGPCC